MESKEEAMMMVAAPAAGAGEAKNGPPVAVDKAGAAPADRDAAVLAKEKLEKKKAEYAEKMRNQAAGIHKAAEEKRASVEATRREAILKYEDMAVYIHPYIHTPTTTYIAFVPQKSLAIAFLCALLGRYCLLKGIACNAYPLCALCSMVYYM
ncbi:remorin isoform X6 [Sorghum bicolor]|uniref:remorin isoform X6 n=1 Tax=Sorghum bicolor TaxID=4558 RepID=UPI000B423E0F|nr:remorin isoform X6 [Sorghum bicolor]|eukprot:XP_021314380.1 remorin isoform X6 [Sorghum bicolor]